MSLLLLLGLGSSLVASPPPPRASGTEVDERLALLEREEVLEPPAPPTLAGAVGLIAAGRASSSPGERGTAGSEEEWTAGGLPRAPLERVLAAGRRGLWALADAAKGRTGIERGRLFHAMGAFRTPEAEWALLQELKRGDAASRSGALRGLGLIPTPANLDRIVAIAVSPASDAERDAALDVMVGLGPRLFDRIPALLSSPGHEARGLALAFVLRAGNRGMVDAAIPAALGDVAAPVRRAGIALVLRAKDPVHAPALGRLARGADAEVGGAALSALVELRGDNAAPELGVIVAHPDTSDEVFVAASSTLRGMGEKGLRPWLDAAVAAPPARRERMISTLCGSITPRELEAAARLAGEPDPERSRIGREILDRTGPVGRAAVHARLARVSGTEQRALLDYLRASDATAYRDELLERARSGAHRERLAAIHLLSELRDATVERRLLELLGAPEPDLRAAAAAVVAGTSPDHPDPDVARMLISLAATDTPVVRAGALSGMLPLVARDPEVAAAAERGLSDPDPGARVAAIRSFRGARGPRVVGVMRARLFDFGEGERAALAELLAGNAAPEAVVLLVELAADPRERVRTAAVRALGAR